jgi:AT-rich interactive domain-containing protein 2
MMAVRRRQLSQSGRSEIPAPAPPTPHPGYAPNAAFNAIKRHALEFVNPKELQVRFSDLNLINKYLILNSLYK